ncbi:D-alanyl-lipoteichoic acid biosynthesis protein DltD [Bacillus massiliigorillae]|uniref:D-alanyl-lipoteichoic acid biosynthesis protein DltD n=1 Tax=Bacillus massiliigorillae TaxID=1243664 RepID=UPI00039D7240|nr:D-alanyl-lipoteichoic acid biosynthesis protein DltD [Bacillus massiliigorillae]
MKKKLWMTFGPVLVAFIIFGFILVDPFKLFDNVSDEIITKGATSMSENVIQGNVIQENALKTGKYVPFFGSSELSRVDAFHPSVFSKKYNLDYTPFLIGRPGTQSLSHYLDIVSLGDHLKNKKVVFILSPQWFQPFGVNDGHFGGNFSPLQAYKFALDNQQITPERIYAARRLLSYRVVQNDSILTNILEEIAHPKTKSTVNNVAARIAGSVNLHILERKDEVDSKVILTSKQERIDKSLKKLPDKLDFNEMDQLAEQEAIKKTNNNPYFINNKYFNKKIKPKEEALRNSRPNMSYGDSPEFADLQLVMDAFKRVNADVLFINPPINGSWYKYINFPQKGLDDYYKKSSEMIQSQGFAYYDMSQYNQTPYYLKDSIHLGWRGWVAINEVVFDFMNQPTTTNHKPTPQDFYQKIKHAK